MAFDTIRINSQLDALADFVPNESTSIWKPPQTTLKISRKEEKIYYSLISENELKMLHLTKSKRWNLARSARAFLDEDNKNSAGRVFGILSRWIDEHLIIQIL